TRAGSTATTSGRSRCPAGHVFMLGDDRALSRDSRTFGPVPEDALAGRLLARVWRWRADRVGSLARGLD
ncbi:MAG: S26 family signal peptidase, partial [Solirubrobacterales bacterium]|nr:S26 family signal peptidase [Solirubrobacterales bacterium]